MVTTVQWRTYDGARKQILADRKSSVKNPSFGLD
jgi:hypothetical protein